MLKRLFDVYSQGNRENKDESKILIISTILIVLLPTYPYHVSVYGQPVIHPTGMPCLFCFYTIEDKPIELGLTPYRTGTLTATLNFDFTQPLNGKLTPTAKGLLYTPNKHFQGNDTFIIQIQNKSTSSGYSTSQVKIVVAGSNNTDKASKPDMTSVIISSISAAIAGFGLVYTARSFRYTSRSFRYTADTFKNNEITKQIEMLSQIIVDVHSLTHELSNIAQEKDTLRIEAQNVGSDQKKRDKIQTQINSIELRQEICMNMIFDKLEWIAFLILKERIKDQDIKGYLIPFFIAECEDIFCGFASDEAKNVDTKYTNMKQLYRDLQHKKLCK